MKTSKNKLSDSISIASNLQKLDDLILLINPNSQGGNTGKNWMDAYRNVKKFLPRRHKIIFTNKPKDGTLMTRKLLRKGYKNIVTVGGDGTINEVANGFFDLKPKNKQTVDLGKFKLNSRLKLVNPEGVMWVVPSGTRNVFGRSLGVRHQGNESLIRLRHMKSRKIDVIGATLTDRDDATVTHNRIVLNAAEIGVGAEIIERSKRVRGKIKSRLISTMAGIVATLPSYDSNECDIVIDRNKKISTRMTMGIVANGNFLGGGFNAAPRAKLSDGMLDVVILKNSGSFKMLDKFIQLKGTSTYKYEEDILYYQASEVTFLPKQNPVTVSIDGEPIGILPAIFKIYHDALTIKSEATLS